MLLLLPGAAPSPVLWEKGRGMRCAVLGECLGGVHVPRTLPFPFSFFPFFPLSTFPFPFSFPSLYPLPSSLFPFPSPSIPFHPFPLSLSLVLLFSLPFPISAGAVLFPWFPISVLIPSLPGLAVHQIITITVSLIMVIAALITTLVLKNW